MSKQNVVFLKLPKGSPAPGNGFVLRTSTRTSDIYGKMKPKITKSDMDDLSSLFGSLGVANEDVLLVPEDQSDDALSFLTSSMGSMGLSERGGKMRKHKRTRKSMRKTRRKSRRLKRKTRH